MMNLSDAYAHCTDLARSHYENFPVGRLVPKHLQKHVHAVYAFARYADDLADEGYNALEKTSTAPLTPEARLKALEEWEEMLQKKSPSHPVFIALQATRAEMDLPLSLFTDLLSAFKQDVVKRRYKNFAEVLDYCRRSANPIGRLVLLLHDERDAYKHLLSDQICTALQLANFWQDVAVDLIKDRIYLPEAEREAFGVTEEDLFKHRANEGYRKLLRFQIERTRKIFDQGEPLSDLLPGILSWEIRLTWLGGTNILRKIESLNYDTLNQRPKLCKSDFVSLFGQACLSSLF